MSLTDRCGVRRPWHFLQRLFCGRGYEIHFATRRWSDVNEGFRFYRKGMDKPYFRCPCGLRASELARHLFGNDANA